MDVDFKIITWQRVTIPEYAEETVLRKLKEGQITTIEEIFEIAADSYMENLEEVETYMTVKENEGYSTIEVLNEEGETIWDNSEL